MAEAGFGLSQQPNCQVLPPNSAGFARFCPYPLDLARAQRLVAASGTAGQTVTVPTGPPGARQSSYLVSVLRSLGYRARLRKFPSVGAYVQREKQGQVPGRSRGVVRGLSRHPRTSSCRCSRALPSAAATPQPSAIRASTGRFDSRRARGHRPAGGHRALEHDRPRRGATGALGAIRQRQPDRPRLPPRRQLPEQPPWGPLSTRCGCAESWFHVEVLTTRSPKPRTLRPRRQQPRRLSRSLGSASCPFRGRSSR